MFKLLVLPDVLSNFKEVLSQQGSTERISALTGPVLSVAALFSCWISSSLCLLLESSAFICASTAVTSWSRSSLHF